MTSWSDIKSLCYKYIPVERFGELVGAGGRIHRGHRGHGHRHTHPRPKYAQLDIYCKMLTLNNK